MVLVDELARNCREENDKYRRKQPSDPTFCFELLRLAFDKREAKAWDAVFAIYQSHIERWCYHYQVDDEQSVKDIIQDSFLRMRESVARLGFENFYHLGSFLRYWKTCVRTLVRKMGFPGVPLPKKLQQPPYEEIAALTAQIWSRIKELFPTLIDRNLIDWSWYQGLPPRKVVEIAKENNLSELDTEKKVKNAKARIKRKMKSDKQLCELLTAYAKMTNSASSM